MAEKERKHHRVHARRLRRREELPFIFHAIRDHFSDLPAHGDAERHAAFVGEGTMMLLSGLAMNGTAPHQQAATLSHAMESVMDAHHNRKRSLTRFVRRSHVPADKLMHDLLDAMVEATDDQHKSWVRMIGQGALIGATRKNAHQYDEVSARAHQELIGKVTNSYWELSDDGLKLFA